MKILKTALLERRVGRRRRLGHPQRPPPRGHLLRRRQGLAGWARPFPVRPRLRDPRGGRRSAPAPDPGGPQGYGHRRRWVQEEDVCCHPEAPKQRQCLVSWFTVALG